MTHDKRPNLCIVVPAGRDGRKEGEASYKLGLAYEHAGDAETALEVVQHGA